MTEVIRGTVEDAPPAVRAAFAVEGEIKSIVREMKRGWVLLAGALYRFHEGEMWRALGYRSFEQWLATPDVDIQRRHVFGLLEVWRTFVIQGGLSPAELEGVGISKLRDIVPAVRRSQVDVTEAIADARELGREDLRQKYDALPVGAAPGDGDAPDTKYWTCPTCGVRQVVR